MKVLLAGSLVLALVSFAAAYSSGPPDNLVGNPSSCVSCHSSFAVNSGNGDLQLVGLPVDGYTPDSTYTLEVVLQDPGQSRWGFELTAALQATPANRGGQLSVVDNNSQLSPGAGNARDYLKQTSAGTRSGTANGPVAWPFHWRAPAAGTVTFYFAGNAADGNGRNSGDYIYTRSVSVAQHTSDVKEATAGVVQQYAMSAYPNPFNPTTTVRISAAKAGSYQVGVFDITGREVARLFNGTLHAGAHNFSFNGTGLPSGVYFARVSGGDQVSQVKLVLIK